MEPRPRGCEDTALGMLVQQTELWDKLTWWVE
jgi:hypothetical protein